MIDIKDHRRYAEGKLAESIKAAEDRVQAKENLLPQAQTDQASTGNDHLDKLIRAIQEVTNKQQAHIVEVSQAGILCLNDELIRKHQAEFFFTQGKLATYKEVVEMIARIVTEAKQSSALQLVP